MPSLAEIQAQMTRVIDNIAEYRSAQGQTTRRLTPGGVVTQTPQVLQVAKRDLLQIASDVRQLAAANPILTPANVVYVTKSPDDPFGGSIQAAIDSIAGQASSTNRYIIDIASPGIYHENVVLPEWVFLVSLSGGPNQTVVLESDSGDTLTIPSSNCGIQGLTVRSTSAVATDTAVRIVPSAMPFGESTLLVLTNIITTTAARGLICEPGSDTVSGVFVGITGNTGVPIGAEILGGGLFLFTGSMQGGATTALRVAGGGICLLQGVALANNSGGGGFIVDVDGGTFAAQSGVSVFDGFNGVQVQNGGTAFLTSMVALSGIAGPTSLSVDGPSTAIIADFNLNPFTGYYDGFSILGTLIFDTIPLFGSGTVAGPDERPASPAPGMTFFATDRAPGTQQLLFVPGTGWLDQTDTVVP